MTNSSQSGFLIQGTFGPEFHSNLELVLPNTQKGFHHCWRDSDQHYTGPPTQGWHPGDLAVSAGINFQYVSLIQSTFGQDNRGNYGNLEAIGIAPDSDPDHASNLPHLALYHTWRRYVRGSGGTQDQYPWAEPYQISSINVPIYGNPAFIRSTFGQRGNFELLFPASHFQPQGPPYQDPKHFLPVHDAGLIHYWRDNDSPPQQGEWPWQFGEKFATEHHFEAVAFLQSQYGLPEPLSDPNRFTRFEVVARSGSQLFHYWRSFKGGVWSPWEGGGAAFFDNAAGIPGFVQALLGDGLGFEVQGNLELVTPLKGGGIQYLIFETSGPDPSLWKWKIAEVLPSSGNTDRVSILQMDGGAYNTNLVVVDGSGNLWWKNNQHQNQQWSSPQRICF